MQQDTTKTLIAHVLKLLNGKGIPLHKVVLHKFLYFLDTQGVRFGLRFEPYTYGPFSFDLARTLDSMAFWDEVEESAYDYSILDLGRYSNPDAETSEKIEKNLALFRKMAEDRFDFKTMERIGTTLYCAESLAVRGERVTEDAVVEDFKAWKGTKYSEKEIRETFHRLQTALPQ